MLLLQTQIQCMGTNEISQAPHLIFACVLYDLCAQIAGFDGAQILLVALPVAGVLVEHVRRTSFCLRLNDGIPKLLSFHHTPSPALLLISEDKQEVWDRSALRNELLIKDRVCSAALTECRAPQTSLPSTPLNRDIHWDTLETNPARAREEHCSKLFQTQQKTYSRS